MRQTPLRQAALRQAALRQAPLRQATFAALQPIMLFAIELVGIERQALPGAGGVATGIGDRSYKQAIQNILRKPIQNNKLANWFKRCTDAPGDILSLIHISSPRDTVRSRMPSSA